VPWVNGRTEAWNVFPLSEQPTRRRTGNSTREAMQQPPPYDVLPPVSLGGVTPSGPAPPDQVDSTREKPSPTDRRHQPGRSNWATPEGGAR
jgi:hypothetical protein